jgi:hypothetical protein
VLPKLVDEYIAVPERQKNGSIHYHLTGAFPFDIRSGFDFASCSAANLIKKCSYLGGGKWAPGTKKEFDALERKFLASANPNLKRVWRVVREANDPQTARRRGRKSFGFGRCQALPVQQGGDDCHDGVQASSASSLPDSGGRVLWSGRRTRRPSVSPCRTTGPFVLRVCGRRKRNRRWT